MRKEMETLKAEKASLERKMDTLEGGNERMLELKVLFYYYWKFPITLMSIGAFVKMDGTYSILGQFSVLKLYFHNSTRSEHCKARKPYARKEWAPRRTKISS